MSKGFDIFAPSSDTSELAIKGLNLDSKVRITVSGSANLYMPYCSDDSEEWDLRVCSSPEEKTVVYGLAAENIRELRTLLFADYLDGLISKVETSDEGLLERLQAVRQPWSVSGPAQCAGVAALGETDFVEHTKEVIKGVSMYH